MQLSKQAFKKLDFNKNIQQQVEFTENSPGLQAKQLAPDK